jgi:hypothetical protein
VGKKGALKSLSLSLSNIISIGGLTKEAGRDKERGEFSILFALQTFN